MSQRQRRPAPHGALDPACERDALRDAGLALSLALDDEAQRRLLEYLALLRKWNAVYNLTAIRDPQAMLVQHLFDCLAIVPPLQPHLTAGATVIDVGSGGGLPGVVLAVCAPQVAVHCVDTVGKKAAFLAQVRAELALPNLHAHHARVEELQAPRDLPPAAVIVSRAFSSLAQFVALTRHLLAADGVWAAMKGVVPEDELAMLPDDVHLLSAITLQVPRLDAQRHLLLLAPGDASRPTAPAP